MSIQKYEKNVLKYHPISQKHLKKSRKKNPGCQDTLPSLTSMANPSRRWLVAPRVSWTTEGAPVIIWDREMLPDWFIRTWMEMTCEIGKSAVLKTKTIVIRSNVHCYVSLPECTVSFYGTRRIFQLLYWNPSENLNVSIKNRRSNYSPKCSIRFGNIPYTQPLAQCSNIW